jgi:hypothetical protein
MGIRSLLRLIVTFIRVFLKLVVVIPQKLSGKQPGGDDTALIKFVGLFHELSQWDLRGYELL